VEAELLLEELLLLPLDAVEAPLLEEALFCEAPPSLEELLFGEEEALFCEELPF
jgi:hypothetical protein